MDDLNQQLEAVYRDLDLTIAALQLCSGLRCRDGCGDCCNSPNVEVMVLEMLPMAKQIIAEGQSDEVYDTLMATGAGRCIHFQGNPEDNTQGRCQRYEKRPSICRLFGFAARTCKNGRDREFIACRWQKTLYAESLSRIDEGLRQGEITVPVYQEVSMLLAGLTESSRLRARLPINIALAQAIEILSIQASYQCSSISFASENPVDGTLNQISVSSAEISSDAALII
ncbi:MAG: YkgJ family cysteine cluster protein [Oligoflexus sp.]